MHKMGPYVLVSKIKIDTEHALLVAVPSSRHVFIFFLVPISGLQWLTVLQAKSLFR